MSASGFFASFPLLRTIARGRSMLGHTPSMVMLGRIYESGRVPGRSIADANVQYRRAADRGDLHGMWHLGVNHLASKDGVTDHEQALHWLNRAAAGGHAMATWALGKMYLAGKLVEPDPQTGLRLLREAAHRDCSPARQALIEIYRDGRYGVAPDPAQLAHWTALHD